MKGQQAVGDGPGAHLILGVGLPCRTLPLSPPWRFGGSELERHVRGGFPETVRCPELPCPSPGA